MASIHYLRSHFQEAIDIYKRILLDNRFVIYFSVLKELRNFNLRIILVGSLFCSVRVYVNLHFLSSILKNYFSSLCPFSVFCLFCHSHEKWKDSLEVSLDRVLFAAQLEFPKILVPRLPQNTSNENIECAGKPKQLYSLCDQLLGALIFLNFIILILICF